jgi:cytochrome c peroxidase
VDGTRSCYSCHRNEDGNGGHEPLAIGAKEKPLPRHSPVLWNVGYLPQFYWDGRSPTLEAQALAAWAGGNMGVGKENLAAKAAEIAAIPGYAQQFAAVFGAEGVTPDTVVKAISAYERTLVCDDTAFDRFQAGDASALTARQQEGWALFQGKAACVACHTPPHFSVAFAAAGAGFFNVGVGAQAAEPDVGRMATTKDEADWGAFKVPSLRNVAKSAPYFHDGSVADLAGAVRLMASGGLPNKNLSPILTNRELTDGEIEALVDFLGSLSCGALSEPQLP